MSLMEKINIVDQKIKEMKVAVNLEENVPLDELVTKVESGGAAPTYKYGNIYISGDGPEWAMSYFNVVQNYTGEIPEIKIAQYTDINNIKYTYDLSTLESKETGITLGTECPRYSVLINDSLCAFKKSQYISGTKGILCFGTPVEGVPTDAGYKYNSNNLITLKPTVGYVFDPTKVYLFDLSGLGTTAYGNFGWFTFLEKDDVFYIVHDTTSSSGHVLIRVDKATLKITHVKFYSMTGSIYDSLCGILDNGNILLIQGTSTSYQYTFKVISGDTLAQVSSQTKTFSSTNYFWTHGTYGYTKQYGDYMFMCEPGSGSISGDYTVINASSYVTTDYRDKNSVNSKPFLYFFRDAYDRNTYYVMNVDTGSVHNLSITSAGVLDLSDTTKLFTVGTNGLKGMVNFAHEAYIDINRQAFVLARKSTSSNFFNPDNEFVVSIKLDTTNTPTTLYYLPMNYASTIEDNILVNEGELDTSKYMYLVALSKTSVPQYAYVAGVIEVRPPDEYSGGEYTYELLHYNYVVYNKRKYTLKRAMSKDETPVDLISISQY